MEAAPAKVKKAAMPWPKIITKAALEIGAKDKHGMSLPALLAYVKGAGYELSDGWEKRMKHSFKLMTAKKELVHMPGHNGHWRLSKQMAAKQERKRGPKKAKEAKPAAEKKVKAAKNVPAKKAAAVKKAKSPAKRAKKAAVAKKAKA